MQFRVLGPFEVLEEDVVLPVGGPRQRALLALLLLHHGRTVPSERLVEEVWGSRPPRTAVAALQNKIRDLRRALGAERIVTRPGGYAIRVEEGELDLDRFESLVEIAAQLEPPARAQALREALSLWRGRPLEGVEPEPFVELEVSRLEELRLAALERRVETDLELGRHSELVPELTALVAEHPLRERLREHLVLALYRSGRQADALAAYHETRRYLADELGLEPTPALRRLEHAILVHDPAVEAPATAAGTATAVEPQHGEANGNGRVGLAPRPAPGPRAFARGRRAFVVAAVAALLAGTAATFVAIRPAGPAHAADHSLAAVDPETGALRATAALGTSPGPLALSDGALWVGDVEDETLLRVDPQTMRVVRTIGLGVVPSELVASDGTIWVASAADGLLLRVNAATDKVEARIDLGEGGRGLTPVAVGPSGVWVGNENEFTLLRLDPQTNAVEWRLDDVSPKAIAVTERDVWVLESMTSEVLRLDPASGDVVARIRVGEGAWSLVATESAVWVGDVAEDAVWWIDARTESVRRTLPVGEDPRRLRVGGGYVWSANTRDGSVSRIDAGTGETTTFSLASALEDVAPSRGRVWASVP